MDRARDRAEIRAALSPEARLDAAIRAEGRRRLDVMTAARIAAMGAVAALVVVIAPYPEFLWYHGLIAAFVVFGLAQFALGRSAAMRVWMIHAFIAADLALLVFTLIYPNPLSDRGFPPQFLLRFGTFSYLYIVLAALAMSLRPSLPL